MAALGRVLQIIGWLWVISGFVAPMFDLPNFGFFPGIILVFVARIVRRQAERQQLPDTSMGPVDPSQMPTPVDMPKPSPPPPPAPASKTPPASALTEEAPRPSEREVEDRDEILQQILLAGVDLAEDTTAQPSAPGDDLMATPKSSAEMIAEARKRWDKSD